MGTVDKAALLLAHLEARADSCGVSELARSTGIAKSTVHRLLATLVRNGVVERTDRKYRSASSSDWAAIREHRFRRLVTIVKPFLLRLYEQTGHSASLVAHLATQALVLDVVYPAAFTETILATTATVDPHCSASGKVLLAHDTGFARRYLTAGGLRAYTPHTLTDPGRLAVELAGVRIRGYAVDRQEQVLGIAAVAAPLIHAGTAFGSLSLAGLVARFQPDDHASLLRQVAVDAAAAVRRHGLTM